MKDSHNTPFAPRAFAVIIRARNIQALDMVAPLSRPAKNEDLTVSQMRKLLGALCVVGLFSTAAFAETPAADDIQARVAKVGSVCMSGDECAAAPVAAAPAGPRSGQQVFDGFCHTCHKTGLMNAPKVGSSADWAPRISQGIETLIKHSITGLNQMPAKGMCANCSDDELAAAVNYMVDNSK